uniref:glycosyltransferase family 2 protein n=1 Tax=Acetatifactor sp. TaxID=1872090 RepID=UPI0040575EB6
MDKLYIVMPAYNEEANIVDVVKEWYPVLEGKDEKSRLVIADGGSKDNTLNILYDLQKEYPKLEVFSKPGTDHGTKLIFLYDYAIKQKADYIFQTDSDGQTNPEEFGQFWDLRNEYDAIMGNRSDREDGKSRVLVENVLRFVLWIFFGAKTPDANAPFRLMKSELVEKYIYRMPEDFNLPNAILAACFSKFNEKVKYLYVSFRPRQGGKNYMNVKRIIKIGWDSIGNFMKLRKEYSKN